MLESCAPHEDRTDRLRMLLCGSPFMARPVRLAYRSCEAGEGGT